LLKDNDGNKELFTLPSRRKAGERAGEKFFRVPTPSAHSSGLPIEKFSMSEKAPAARRGVDVVALTLCVLGGFVAFSLFHRTGAERFARPAFDDWTSAPAQLGYRLFEALGLAAFALSGAWFVLALIRFRGPGWFSFARRTFGCAVMVVGAAVIADRFGTGLPGPATGNGGVIGAEGSLRLDRSFTPAAGISLLSAWMFVGLFLAADAVIRSTYRLAVLLIGLVFSLLEHWLLTVAVVLEWMARQIGKCLRPGTAVTGSNRSPSTTVSPLANPMIPIHHHLEAAAKDAGNRPPAQPRTFPRITPAESEDTSAPPRPYDLPPLDMLDEPVAAPVENHEQRLIELAAQVEKACADFGLAVKVVGIHTGPVITQYEISLETGLRVSKILSLSDDLALHLKVPSVRIIAPIPGKNTVGIEVPNEHRASVRLKELVAAAPSRVAKMKLPLFLGKDSEGRALIHDLADMPHLLIAGRTGTGKSVCLNSIILSLLLTRRPDECKLIMIDPKQVELAEYGRLPHLMHPVVTDNKKAEAILSWAVDKMEERYEVLRRARVRNIGGYNELEYAEILRRVRPVDDDEKQIVPAKMPCIVIVVDEVGDLMMAMKKEVEGHIIRLAQKSRAAGIHLILTTQRPTVDVITGLIKSNLPARICFQVADRSNSRVVLDEMGAEKLLGKGDMLFLQPNTSTIVRAQGTYASDAEILRIVGRLEVEQPNFDSELLQLKDRIVPGRSGMMESIRKRDELYEEAIEIVIREGRGSVSLLQRALGIGYGRAARLIDYMAEDGIVGHYNSGQAREVLFTPDQWDEMKRGGNSLAESA
jgi:DNA segregation ATPase FtsK/SpoIIIE, S-DNA-T family